MTQNQYPPLLHQGGPQRGSGGSCCESRCHSQRCGGVRCRQGRRRPQGSPGGREFSEPGFAYCFRAVAVEVLRGFAETVIIHCKMVELIAEIRGDDESAQETGEHMLHRSVCMSIHMILCIYVYMCIHIYIYIYTYIYIYIEREREIDR